MIEEGEIEAEDQTVPKVPESLEPSESKRISVSKKKDVSIFACMDPTHALSL